MKESVRRRARELGFDDCRFTRAIPPGSGQHYLSWLADGRHGDMGYLERQTQRRLEPDLVLPGVQTIVSLAASYHRATVPPHAAAPEPGVDSAGPAGVVARYARFRDYHQVLSEPLESLSDFINAAGGPNTRSLAYVDTGPILEREYGERAGLGFVGKHTNLISRRLGNWFFLAEVLTTAAFDPDPPERNRCGSCTRCLTACPTQAITAPFQLDARRCISYLTIEHKGTIPIELRPLMGNRVFGCDDCLEVCPWNRFARTGRLLREAERLDLDAPALTDLLELDEAGFRERFRRTPLWRGSRQRLLRNVCVALGNLGDPAAVPALERAARETDRLIAEHARWAMRRIAELRGEILPAEL